MLSIRRATDADVSALVPLKAALHDLHVVQRPDVFTAMSAEKIAEWLRERLSGDALVWVAEDDGVAVGYALAARQRHEVTPFSHAREWYEVDEVAVAHEHRRRGIARALVERVVDHARQDGMAVQLTAGSFNHDSHAAFASGGFLPMIVRYELTP